MLWVFKIPGPDLQFAVPDVAVLLGLFRSVRMSADLCPLKVHNLFGTKVLV